MCAGKNSGSFGEEVRQAGLEEIYSDLGLVDRKESLQLQARSSILLMAGWTYESDVVEWSGKMYEYMMAARPVVYMMNTTIPWTLPARDMHRLGGVCYENCRHEETLPELREYVRKMYRMWKKSIFASLGRTLISGAHQTRQGMIDYFKDVQKQLVAA